MRKPKQTHGLTNLGTGPRKRGRVPHADDFAVDGFAHEMKEKLAQKRGEGRGGWENKEECSAEFLSQLLREHVEKGDPIDVANFCMMLHQRGERIATPQPASTALIERLTKALSAVNTWAEQRCPCRNEVPNPCPLCGADANKPGDICLSAENTFPRDLLTLIRAALSASQSTSREGER